MTFALPPSIPVIDISAFTTEGNDIAVRQSTAAEVAEKCSVSGCLAITGHGLSPQFFQDALSITRRLFDLPIEDKMKAPHPAGMVPHRGYSAPGKERAFEKADHNASDAEHQQMLRKTQDFKESYEVGDDANERDYNIWLPEDTLPGFRLESSRIFGRLRELSFAVLEALIMGIGVTDQERNAALDVHSGPVGQLRLLHYPSLEVDRRVIEEVKRLPAHTDWSSFTLSFQDTTGGLQFMDRRTGKFMSATPSNDIVYLNVGDMLERLSNGLYPACTHRVVLPNSSVIPVSTNEHGNTRKASARYSVVFFMTVNREAVVAPPTSRVKKDGTARFEPTTYAEYAEARSKWHYKDYENDGQT